MFGGRAIPEKLGRGALPDGLVAETWEVSDVEGYMGEVMNGALAGQSLRRIVDDHPEDLMGRGWGGGYFPLLTKYIDASGMLPVHLHADDEPVEWRPPRTRLQAGLECASGVGRTIRTAFL